MLETECLILKCLRKGIFYYGVAAKGLEEKYIIENVCFEYVKCNVT